MNVTVNQFYPNSLDFATVIRWWLYPTLWLWLIGCVGYAYYNPDQFQQVLMVKGGVMVALLLLIEWAVPYQKRWGMSWQFLLKRDLVFIAVNGVVFGLLSFGLAALAVIVSTYTQGPMSGKPIWLQVIVGLLVFEALQYSIHRLMHQSHGPLTHWLWRTHAIHHLPQQLYVIMHAVFHPFNAVIVRLMVGLLPLWALGYDPYAVLIYSSIIAYHGTISHFNVDIRMGWVNYLFVGPELHRYHHSANSNEAVNFGATLSVFDLLFNSFLYKPGTPPEELGLREENGYPGQIDPLGSLMFPLSFKKVSATKPL